VALAAALAAVNLPGGRLALLLGLDRLMTQIRAATNPTSNVIATLNGLRGPVDCERATGVEAPTRHPQLGAASGASCRQARFLALATASAIRVEASCRDALQ
jgi:hypothetical protein